MGLTKATAPLVPQHEAHEFEIGSKSLFVAWITYISLTWCLKCVLLSLYSRLTSVMLHNRGVGLTRVASMGLTQRRLVKVIAIVCFLSWSTCIIAHFAVCVPIQRAWQINPYPGGAWV